MRELRLCVLPVHWMHNRIEATPVLPVLCMRNKVIFKQGARELFKQKYNSQRNSMQFCSAHNFL